VYDHGQGIPFINKIKILGLGLYISKQDQQKITATFLLTEEAALTTNGFAVG